VPLLLQAAGRVEASLPLRAAALATGADPEIGDDHVVLGRRSIATDLGHVLPLAFYGPRGTIRTVSAGSVLAGGIEPGLVSGRIVVIGATVTGGGDVFPSPFDPVLPGVEVVSTAIAHLVEGDGPVRNRTVRLADAGISVVLPMLLVGLVAWRRSAIGLMALAGTALAWAALNVAAFSEGIWLSAALPIAAALPPVMLFGAMQLWQDRNRAQHFASQSALLQRVQAPGLGKWLAAHSDFLAEPVRTDAAVVFIDLSGFTGLSETLGPSATRDVLNGFHALVDDEVAACGGIVTSYMGDGSMILFGLPEPAREDAANAARCSVGLCRRTRAWLDGLPAPTSKRLGFKVGAHYGTIVASRLGGESHQHIAATGDTVNVASRLMEIAAAHGAELALSDELLRVTGKADLFESGMLTGPVEAGVRGRAGSLAVWLWRGRVSEAVLRPERAP
jgi:adenylate cyclase